MGSMLKRSCLAIFTVALAFTHGAVSEAAPPPVSGPAGKPQPVKPLPPAQKVDPPQPRRFVKMTTKNTFGAVGDSRTLEATLTQGSGGAGAPGKSVVFRLSRDGTPIQTIGTALTNNAGKATLSWKLPEYPAAQYTLTASFAGDDDAMPASDDAQCGIFKSTTAFWPTYQGGRVLVTVRRESDNTSIVKQVFVSVDGGERRAYTTPVEIPLPAHKDVYVVMEFEGDQAYQKAFYHDRYQL